MYVHVYHGMYRFSRTTADAMFSGSIGVEQNKVVCQIASRFLSVQLLLSLSDTPPTRYSFD